MKFIYLSSLAIYAEKWLEYVEGIEGTTFDEKESQFVFRPANPKANFNLIDWWINKAVDVIFTEEDHRLTMESVNSVKKTTIHLYFTSEDEKENYVKKNLKKVKLNL